MAVARASRKREEMSNKGTWISIDERPKETMDVLFCCPDDLSGHAIYRGVYFADSDYFASYGKSFPVGDVTYWMPIPEPP